MIAAALILGGYGALVWLHPGLGAAVAVVHIIVMLACTRG